LCGRETMKKTIASIQSSYIPWKGYFDIINRVDEFILYDDVQFTKGDWRNRNFIKTAQGLQWLTIPVLSKGRISSALKIQEVRVKDSFWALRHWKTICQNYAAAPFFEMYKTLFETYYLHHSDVFLSDINSSLIKIICGILEIKTPIRWSRDYVLSDDRNIRLVELCRQMGATHYLSGPTAKSYLDVDLLQKYGVEVMWMDYTGYPEYTQVHSPFEHGVSIIDLIFNQGPRAKQYMKGAR